MEEAEMLMQSVKKSISSRIQQPSVRINPNLGKIKMEVDYNPVLAPKEEPIEENESEESNVMPEEGLIVERVPDACGLIQIQTPSQVLNIYMLQSNIQRSSLIPLGVLVKLYENSIDFFHKNSMRMYQNV